MINYNITVYGVNQITGEYKIVFRCISLLDWLKRGHKTAKQNNYDNFTFYTVPCLQNKFLTKQIIL